MRRRSFYELDADGNRQRAHYDGLPFEFIAEAISTLGVNVREGFQTYHVMNPYDDGIGMDQFVDWLVEAGYAIQRVDGYGDWLGRFETTLRALPEKQRNASLLPLLHNYQKPEHPLNGSIAPTERFQAAVQEAKIGPDKDIPHVSAPVVREVRGRIWSCWVCCRSLRRRLCAGGGNMRVATAQQRPQRRVERASHARCTRASTSSGRLRLATLMSRQPRSSMSAERTRSYSNCTGSERW